VLTCVQNRIRHRVPSHDYGSLRFVPEIVLEVVLTFSLLLPDLVRAFGFVG